MCCEIDTIAKTLVIMQKNLLQALLFVPKYVFLEQIDKTWDKMYHITNLINFRL
jgi:hypothetical protein